MNNKPGDFTLILKEALGKLVKENRGQPKGRCLTEEDIAGMLDQGVPEAERKPLLEHILSCQKCADLIQIQLQISEALEKEEAIESSDAVVQEAMDLAGPEPLPLYRSLWESLLTFINNIPPLPLQFETLELIPYEVTRGAGTLIVAATGAATEEEIFKIKVSVNQAGWVYLSEIKDSAVELLIEPIKIKAKKEYHLPEKLIKKEGKIILFICRKKLKNKSLLLLKETLLKNYALGEADNSQILKEALKDKNILLKIY
jgi:hypothetical protein